LGVGGLTHRNVQRFRGGLVFKAHRLLYHSTLGLKVIEKKKKVGGLGVGVQGLGLRGDQWSSKPIRTPARIIVDLRRGEGGIGEGRELI